MIAMQMQVEVVYENGVLRPLAPLELKEHQHITITLSVVAQDEDWPQLDDGYVESLRREMKDAGPVPTLEEVRRRLSKIPGELTADFIAERRERGEPEERGER
jgi:predicted DNA-binding antitoxin AbrB/MazE fold protein